MWQGACPAAQWLASSEPSLMSRPLNASSLQTHTALTHQTASECMRPAKAVTKLQLGSLQLCSLQLYSLPPLF